MVKHAGCIVQNVAIYLANRDQGLQWVAQRVLGDDEPCHDKRRGAPENLLHRESMLYWVGPADSAYRSNRFHAQHKRILRQVAGV